MTFTEDLFVTDRDRITCSGGTAPLYLMLDLMARRYGDAVAAGVSEQFILDRIRSATEKQHIPMAARIGVNRRELLSTAAAAPRAELLLQTDMSVMSVTVACGFQSPCHFSKAYRSQFGHPPNSERPALRA